MFLPIKKTKEVLKKLIGIRITSKKNHEESQEDKHKNKAPK